MAKSAIFLISWRGTCVHDGGVLTYIAQAGISCGQVASTLGPCAPYAKGGCAISPPGGCCSGINSLLDVAKTIVDRQAACWCLKSATSIMSGLNYGVVSRIPRKCVVGIPYKISPAANCNKLVNLIVIFLLFDILFSVMNPI